MSGCGFPVKILAVKIIEPPSPLKGADIHLCRPELSERMDSRGGG